MAAPASRQATNLHQWWRKNRPASPDLFARELEAARKFIASTPELGTVYVERNGTVVRRVLMPKTKNHAYYEIDREKGIAIILAVIYKPAIEQAKLTAVRADSDIFGTGKIIDQILVGMSKAKVLVAELTGRNPNVFYELGVAHALRKPVVLVSADAQDVPFDVKHIRVITYDKHDPFWGQKLMTKVAENILSALQNPTEGILQLPGAST